MLTPIMDFISFTLMPIGAIGIICLIAFVIVAEVFRACLKPLTDDEKRAFGAHLPPHLRGD